MRRYRSSSRLFTLKMRQQYGVTIVELLIVLAIIGVLAAIAYPNYNKHMEKMRRADGHLALQNAAQLMEQCHTLSNSYADCSLSNNTSEEGYYQLSLKTAVRGFTVTATGVDLQASDADCRVMTIDQRGNRTPDTSKSCWPQ